MNDTDREIEAALASTDPISRDRAIAWIDAARDLSTLRLLYQRLFGLLRWANQRYSDG